MVTPTPNIAQTYPPQVSPWPASPQTQPVFTSPILSPSQQHAQDTVTLSKFESPVIPSMGLLGKTLFSITHPITAFNLLRYSAKYPVQGESSAQRWAMTAGLMSILDFKGRSNLQSQIRTGRLFNTDAEDRRSTLSHLFQIAALPRAQGLEKKTVLNDTLRLLAHPETITQRFAPLKMEAQQALMQYLNTGKGPQLAAPVTPESFSDHSATCVSSSVMYTLFSKQPSEAVRHIAELTSPKLSFTEQAKAHEISPDNPSLAEQKLQQYKINGRRVSPDTFVVDVSLPYTGLVRAINQQNSKVPNTQSVVESAYQSALTKLAAFNYEPGLGTLVMPDGKLDQDPGIVADQKTLMESIMKDTGPVMQVDYQVTAADRNNEPYLMGYLRPFEKIYGDLVRAVNLGHNVIIGIVDTDKTGPTRGRLNLKHEVTVVGHKDGVFQIADSDDDVPRLIKKSAKELIPQIHHAGLPEAIGRRVQQEATQLSGRYMTPDGNDAKSFQLIDMVPADIQPSFMADFQQRQAQEMQAQQAQQMPQVSQQAQASPMSAVGYTTAYQMYPQYAPAYYYPGYPYAA